MEEARNLNFCRTNGSGASELQHKIVLMPRLAEISFQSISLEINYMNKYKLLCPRGTQTCALAVANIKVYNGNGKVILDTHPESDQHQN